MLFRLKSIFYKNVLEKAVLTKKIARDFPHILCKQIEAYNNIYIGSIVAISLI